ncbi:MAG: TnsA endonuclease N-terminal domain-containing protein [bacterium]
MQWCDINENIIYWESEPIGIPYQHPIEMRDARYYVDFLIKCKTKNDKEKIFLIEVKPYKECKPPIKSKGKSKKTLLHEAKT